MRVFVGLLLILWGLAGGAMSTPERNGEAQVMDGGSFPPKPPK
jgi:hypothetical protein